MTKRGKHNPIFMKKRYNTNILYNIYKKNDPVTLPNIRTSKEKNTKKKLYMK